MENKGNWKRKTMMLGLFLASMGALLSCAGGASSSNASQSEDTSSTSGNKVYFAGPLFNAGEKEWNLRVVTLLEKKGYEVFLPQRDGFLAAEIEGKSEDELTQMIFALDESKVRENDIVFANLDGRAPDEGTCVELGIAYALGKRCYGFKTDARSVEINMDLNPMIVGCMRKIFKNFDGDALLEDISDYLNHNRL